MPDTIDIEGGEVFANLEERTIAGLLIPYNEVGRTNLGRFQVEAGAVQLPADPSVVSLNLDHVRSANVGRATKLWEAPEGIMASFTIARTPEGDAALADATDPNGRRRKLSGEFGPAVIRAGRLVAGHAKLWGSGLVEAGAFPSAQVLAADTPDPAPADAPTEPTPAEPLEPVDGVLELTATETPEAVAVTVADTTTTYTPAAEEEPTVAVPNTLATATPVEAPQHNLGAVYASIAAYRANPHDEGARSVLAALADIKISGTGALPATGVLQPNWVGDLAAGVGYSRQFITLHKLGTSIAAGGKQGFKLNRRTGSSGTTAVEHWPNLDWAGNKSDINTGSAFTATAGSVLDRFAFGADIAREFYDLPGGAAIVEAFLRLIVEDHLYWSDQKALSYIIANAGAPIAPKAYPAKYADTPALGMLIQGILAAKRRKGDGKQDVPTYAIANPEAYEQLLYTPKDLIPEFITFNASTDGTATADGIKVTEGDTGIEDNPSVIVGADYAIEFDELAGGPLHIDALEIAKGGIDRAVHGYLQTFIVRPEAIVRVGTPDA
jgi:hypothetical protein